MKEVNYSLKRKGFWDMTCSQRAQNDPLFSQLVEYYTARDYAKLAMLIRVRSVVKMNRRVAL